VSVVVCAYTERRWADIVRAVASVTAQRRRADELLLVVDHNEALAERAAGELTGVKVVRNAHARGLSGARNTGVELATGEVIAFLDDDAAARPDWLERLLAPYRDPSVAAVGGAAVPRWPDGTGRPATLPARHADRTGELDWVVGCSYAGQPAGLAEVRNLMGSNMSFRRDVFGRVGGFSDGIGRVGSTPLGCEETELCIRLRQRVPGARIVFEPAAVVVHRVGAARTGWRYLLRRCWAEGLSKAAISRTVGRHDALSAERAYLTRVLPAAVARQLRAGALAGALAIAAAVLVTASGYLWGLSRHAGGVPGSGSAVPASPPTAPEPATAPGWHLRFDAHFAGSRLDTSVWATCYPWADTTAGCTNFGNAEYQWYLPAQVHVLGGALHLVAQQVPTLGRASDGAPKEYFCRSGMVTSYPGFRFEYGYLQIVAKIPSGSGLWPALWLVAGNLRWPPEIDIVESWGPPSEHTGAYFHPAGGPRIYAQLAPGGLSSRWHAFGLSWTPSQLVWFVDGRAVLSTRQHVPHQLMYLIADLADYRPPHAGGGCEGTLLIRSVRVWQRLGATSAGPPGAPPAGNATRPPRPHAPRPARAAARLRPARSRPRRRASGARARRGGGLRAWRGRTSAPVSTGAWQGKRQDRDHRNTSADPVPRPPRNARARPGRRARNRCAGPTV
jgi:beta-glucanase (GH16 family)/GT2 family glycosyltransferase